jgi:hypothetical protein
MQETIDAAARRDVAVIESRLDSHEKFCVERAASAEKFEKDIRLYLTSLNSKIDHYISRNDRLIRTVSGSLITVLCAAVASLVVYIWQTK